jgi:hypothetical protein
VILNVTVSGRVEAQRDLLADRVDQADRDDLVVIGDPWDNLVRRDRAQASAAAIAHLRTEIDTWVGGHTGDGSGEGPYRLFPRHFDALRRELLGALAENEQDVDVLLVGDPPAPGRLHADLRRLDAELDQMRDLFRWYTHRCEQRVDPRLSDTLAAADQLVRSCWDQPVERLRRQQRPLAPLAYVDEWQAATATFRGGVPEAIRHRLPDGWEHLHTLPVPAVAIPTMAAAEPWWLIVVGHEVGHHLERELGVRAKVRLPVEIEARTGKAEDLPALSARWGDWAEEAFADAVAVCCFGPAAAWVVAEFEYDDVAALLPDPAGAAAALHPPPAVRLALYGELAAQLGFTDPGPGRQQLMAWLNGVGDRLTPTVRRQHEAHLTLLPAVAAALLDLSVDGLPLRAWYGLGSPGAVNAVQAKHNRFRRALLDSPQRPGRLDRTSSARHLLAAGLAAWRRVQVDPASSETVRLRLLDALAASGPPGTFEAPSDQHVEGATRALIRAVRDARSRTGPSTVALP